MDAILGSSAPFDDTTIFAFNAAVHCVIAIGLYVCWVANREVCGVGNWALAYVALTLGFLAPLLTGVLPVQIARVVLVTALFIGAWQLLVGLCLYRRSPPPSNLLFILALGTFVTFNLVVLVIIPDYRAYHLGLTAFVLPLTLAAIRMALKSDAGEEPISIYMAATLGLVALALIVHALQAAFDPPSSVVDQALNTRTQLMMFIASITSTSLGLGLVIMTTQAHKRELVQQATVDPLTDLLNRRAFSAASLPALSQCRREQMPVSVMMMDVDHFKSLNDTYGHLAGDDVLRGFAEIIRQCMRGQDIIGRFGGEEFIAILPRTGVEAAQVVAERLRMRLEGHTFVHEGHKIQCSVSVGVACKVHGDGALDDMIAEADEALYRAKDKGRNRVELVVDGVPTASEAAA